MPRWSGLCEDIRAENTEAQAALGILGLPTDFDEVAQQLYHQRLHGRFLQAGEDHLVKRCSHAQELREFETRQCSLMETVRY